MSVPHVRVAICGAGFAGIGAAIRLLASGERDFVVLERATEVGGVWRDNTYPGCACDVESHLYCYSFAPNPRWSHTYSPQPEIWSYLQDCVERFGVTPHLRLGHEVQSAAWDSDAQAWRIETSNGAFIAEVLVAGFGALSEPKPPSLPGLDAFAGDVFHSARWNHAVALGGKRVAVIGTGASATQIVPALQPKVQHLTLFQRTPAWVFPRNDAAIPTQRQEKLAASPTAQTIERTTIYARRELLAVGFLHPTVARLGEAVALRFLEAQVHDPSLRARLTPTYRFGCKRVVVSDDYLASLNADNVTVTSAAVLAQPRGLVDTDGTVHDVDAIVFATGFHTTELPYARIVRGRSGASLAQVWDGTPRAHLGTTVSDFPNLFLISGPNTGLGHSSVVLLMETQIEHLLGALAFLAESGAASIEPRAKAQAEFVADVERRMRGTVWTTGGCDSWYLDRNGHNSTLWPGYTFDFKRRVERFDESEYLVERRRGEPVEPTPFDRVEAAVGKVVGTLPSFAQRLLAGGKTVIDGLTLAPDLELILKARAILGGSALLDDTPIASRARMRRDAAIHAGPLVEVGSTRDFSIGPLRARHHAPKLERAPLLVYFHGGGFMTGDLDTHDVITRRLCRDAGVHVLAVDYRLAPEHRFPAAVDDALSVFAWAREHVRELGADGRVAVSGDSAGGNLATVVSQAHRGAEGPCLQVLLYPVVDRTVPYASLEHFAHGFMLARSDIDQFDAAYLGPDLETLHLDPRASPGLAASLHDVAPALVYTAGFDPLRDEGEAYAERLRHAGSLVELRRFAGLVHGFASMVGVSPSSDAALTEVTSAIARFFAARGAHT